MTMGIKGPSSSSEFSATNLIEKRQKVRKDLASFFKGASFSPDFSEAINTVCEYNPRWIIEDLKSALKNLDPAIDSEETAYKVMTLLVSAEALKQSFRETLFMMNLGNNTEKEVVDSILKIKNEDTQDVTRKAIQGLLDEYIFPEGGKAYLLHNPYGEVNKVRNASNFDTYQFEDRIVDISSRLNNLQEEDWNLLKVVLYDAQVLKAGDIFNESFSEQKVTYETFLNFTKKLLEKYGEEDSGAINIFLLRLTSLPDSIFPKDWLEKIRTDLKNK